MNFFKKKSIFDQLVIVPAASMVAGLLVLTFVIGITYTRFDRLANEHASKDLSTLKKLTNIVLDMGDIQHDSLKILEEAENILDEEGVYVESQKVLDRTRALLNRIQTFDLKFSDGLTKNLAIKPAELRAAVAAAVEDFLNKQTSALVMVTVDLKMSGVKMRMAEENFRVVVHEIEHFSADVTEQVRQGFAKENARIKNENILFIVVVIFVSLLMIRFLVRYVGKISDRMNEISTALEKLADDSEAAIPEFCKHEDFNSMISSLIKYKETQVNLIKTLSELKDMKVNLELIVDSRTEQLKIYENIFQSTDEAIYLTDMSGVVMKANKAFESITGYAESEIIGSKISVMKSGVHGSRFYQEMNESVNTTGSWSGEIWNKRKDGSIYPQILTINILFDSNNSPFCYLGIFHDISVMKETEKKLEKMAYYDNLTGLANRIMFTDSLTREIKYSERYKLQFAVLYIDLDGFKQVNDTMGHNEGDEVLKEVACRLMGCLRDSDISCRVGGDEFTAILKRSGDVKGIENVANKIINEISMPIETSAGIAKVGASIGVSIFPENGRTMDEIVTSADTAMYEAKSKGKGQVCFSKVKTG